MRDVGQLVGAVDRQRLAVGGGDPFAVLGLALAVGLDRFVVGQRPDQAGDLVAELLAQLLERRLGVLDHVVQQRRRQHLVAEAVRARAAPPPAIGCST